MAKPNGWWTTHPTILTVTVAGCWDSNGDGICDFEGIRRHLDELIEMGITGLRFQHVTRPVGGTVTVDLGRFGFKLFAVGRDAANQ